MAAEIIRHPAEFKAPEVHRRSNARWWMPLDVAQFIADVAGMDAEGAGALMMAYCHYFRHGSLPNDEDQLARICKLSRAKFRRRRDQLSTFFEANWKHPALDATIEKIEGNIEKKRAAGARGGVSKSLASARHPRSNQDQDQDQEAYQEKDSASPSPLPPPAEPRAREAAEIAAEALGSLTASERAHPGWTGLRSWIDQALTDGAARVDLVVGIAQALRSLGSDPPASFEYFRRPIERARAARARPLPDGGPAALSVGAFEFGICNHLGEPTGLVRKTIGEDRLTALHARYLAGAVLSALADEVRGEVSR